MLHTANCAQAPLQMCAYCLRELFLLSDSVDQSNSTQESCGRRIKLVKPNITVLC